MTSQDPNIDGLLAILTPAGHDRPDGNCPGRERSTPRSPASPCWQAGWEAKSSKPGERILDQAGIATFAYPDTAAQTFTAMWRSFYNLQALYETPTLPARQRDRRVSRRTSHGDHRCCTVRGTQLFSPKLNQSRSWQPMASRPLKLALPRPRSDACYSLLGRSAFRSCSSSIPRRSRTRPTSAACSST